MTFPYMYVIIVTTFTSITLPPLPTPADPLPLVPPLLSWFFFFLNDCRISFGLLCRSTGEGLFAGA